MDERLLKEEFENFVIGAHVAQYQGCGDEILDDYGEWLIDLEPEDWIALGAKFAVKKIGRDKLKAKIILGQEVICPDGLGRVAAFNFAPPNNWVQVQTYINDRQCKWDIKNVTLVDL